MDGQYFCTKCHRTMGEDNFYSSNNLAKYPEGKIDQCKKCFTMHVDNWDEATFKPLLEVLDVPYLPDEWRTILAKWGSKSNLTGMTILGRYISKMKLKQFREFRYADSDHLLKVAQKEKEAAMKRQGMGAAEIDTILREDATIVPDPTVAAEPDDYFAKQSAAQEIEYDITAEELQVLTLYWGNQYKVAELIQLEQLKEDMLASYDIQSAGHIDTMKLTCKTSLKAHQLVDMGDIEGFQKVTKVYDSLMKSGSFTAAQNKAASGDFVDSIGQLVAECEKDGFIPRYYTADPQDKADETLLDLQKYNRDLIANEPNLASLIETAVATMLREENKEEDEDTEDDELTLEGLDAIKDEEFAELNDMVDEEQENDAEALESLLNEGEKRGSE